jgi:hypothetical protein
MRESVSPSREIIVGSVLILIRASLIALTGTLVVIRPRLVLITGGLVAIRPRLILSSWVCESSAPQDGQLGPSVTSPQAGHRTTLVTTCPFPSSES